MADPSDSTAPKNPMMASLLPMLLESGEYSDMTLVCQGQEFKVHHNVVCPQSPVIKRAMLGDFQESDDRRLSVDFKPESLRLMLDFIYCGDYDVQTVLLLKETTETGSEKATPSDDSTTDEETTTGGTQGEAQANIAANGLPQGSTQPLETVEEFLSYPNHADLVAHIHVNSIADYYDLPDLCRLARANVKHCLDRNASLHIALDRAWSFPDYFVAWDLIFKDLVTGDKELMHLMGHFAGSYQVDIPRRFEDLHAPPEFWLGFVEAWAVEMKALRDDNVKKNLDADELQAEIDVVDKQCAMYQEESENRLLQLHSLKADLKHCDSLLDRKQECWKDGCTSVLFIFKEDELGYYSTFECAKCGYAATHN